MRFMYYARLVCPDDPTDFIFYPQRESVPPHLQDDLERLEAWAESIRDMARTEYGDLHAGPGLLEAMGRPPEQTEWVAVPVTVVECRPHPTLGHMLVLPPAMRLGGAVS